MQICRNYSQQTYIQDFQKKHVLFTLEHEHFRGLPLDDSMKNVYILANFHTVLFSSPVTSYTIATSFKTVDVRLSLNTHRNNKKYLYVYMYICIYVYVYIKVHIVLQGEMYI